MSGKNNISIKELNGLDIKTPTWATPTILFLDNGTEVFAHQGYMAPEEFYQALGVFKLGGSEAYTVAFNEGTDAKFCKQNEIFKDTPDDQVEYVYRQAHRLRAFAEENTFSN